LLGQWADNTGSRKPPKKAKMQKLGLTYANQLEENRQAFLVTIAMKATVKHVRISPKKAGIVADLVRGKGSRQALDFLKFANKKAADIIYKLLASAVANAENNDGKDRDNLVVSKIFVTKGRILKRGVPAARGRVKPIVKRTSHIFVELEEGLSSVSLSSAAGKPAKRKPAAKKAPTAEAATE
jgi:large subunit ribosomal protein L22